MSLKHAMLVSLAERPASGYDLVRRFDRSVGYFWRASHQQIYRELPKLEAAEWVSAEAVAQRTVGPQPITVRTVSVSRRRQAI